MGTSDRVLVVDDDTNLGALMKNILEDEGYQVEWLQTPAREQTWWDALCAKVTTGIEGQPFDLILMDVDLQHKRSPALKADGRVLTDALHKSAALIKPPIIIASAGADVRSVLPLIAQGAAVRFLNKPFKLDELLETVAQAIKAYHTPTAAPGNETHPPAH